MDDAEFIRDKLAFPQARIALRVDRDLIDADGQIVSHDTRHFLTSLDPSQVTADDLLATVREHWQIENGQFFIKDRWWDEDRHPTRRPGLSEFFATFTSLALSVLHVCRSPREPLRAFADRIQWLPRLGLELLGLT